MKTDLQPVQEPKKQSPQLNGELQRAALNEAPVTDVPPIVHEVLQSPGQPLDVETRAFFEPRFGHDFSGVRVHTDAKAAESARAVNALAYTVGNSVVFASGKYQLGTYAGHSLLTHELSHVVEQGQFNRPFALYRQTGSANSKGLEKGWTQDIASSGQSLMTQIQQSERIIAPMYPAFPAPIKMSLAAGNLESGFAIGLLAGFSEFVTPVQISDYVSGVEGHYLEMLQGELIGLPKGIADDIIGNLKMLATLAALMALTSPIGLPLTLNFLGAMELSEWIKDPAGRLAMYRDCINRLTAFLEYVNANPSALLAEGRDLGQTIGRLIGTYLRKEFFLEPNYQKKGELIGYVFGIVASEVALALLGGVVVKAIGKVGVIGGARVAAPMLKNTSFAERIAAILKRPGTVEIRQAAKAGEKTLEGTHAAQTTGELARESKILTQTGSQGVSSTLHDATTAGTDVALASGKATIAPRTLPHKAMLQRFTDMFRRPGPPAEQYVVHSSFTDFEQAYQAAGGKNGATIGFFDPNPPPTIHLPPGSDELTVFHEALHWGGNQGGVRQAVGQFMEEGLTEWLARRALGVKVARHPYNQHIALIELLSKRVGPETLERAYLHGEWQALQHSLERSLGSSGQAEEIFRLLRQVGPNGEGGEHLSRVMDWLFPGSAEAGPLKIVPAAKSSAPFPSAFRPAASEMKGSPAVMIDKKKLGSTSQGGFASDQVASSTSHYPQEAKMTAGPTGDVKVDPRVVGAASEVTQIEHLNVEKLNNWFKTLDAVRGGRHTIIVKEGKVTVEFRQGTGISIKATTLDDAATNLAYLERKMGEAADKLVEFTSWNRTEGGVTHSVRNITKRELNLIFDQQAIIRNEKNIFRVMENLKKKLLKEKAIYFEWFVDTLDGRYSGTKWYKKYLLGQEDIRTL